MNLSLDLIAGVVALVLAVVWLVRLEGRVNALATTKADAAAVAVTNEKVAGLEASAKVHESTKEEVIRLQEQIKHLTSLVESWMRAQGGKASPNRRNSGTAD